jgi:hypothetical protein
LLSNNTYKLIGIIYIFLFICSCGEKIKRVNFDDPRAVRNVANKLLEDNIKFSKAGYFSSDSTRSIIAGTESSEMNKFGISFSLIDLEDDELKVVYTTSTLDGSFDNCIVDKMKFSSDKYEMIYYNSKDYYLGSGGGDVYLYIINFINREVYYAHLMVERSAGASLYISDNIEDPTMRQFFISYFKKDYHALRIVSSDVL